MKLHGKNVATLMLLGVVAGIGLTTGTTASAKKITSYTWNYGNTKNYKWSAPKDDAAPLYYTNTKKNGYIWNKKFTKKLHNIKNYQYTSWYVHKSFKRHGKVYYKVTGNKVSGYVWHGYVAPAIAKDISTFKSDSSYIKYLKTDKSQKLSRALLKYFPGAKVSLDVSRRGANLYNGKSLMDLKGYEHAINLTALNHKQKLANFTYSENIYNILEDPVTKTNAAKAKNVYKVLKKNGYTKGKIKELINQGYKLGIYMDDGMGASASKSGYPWKINTFFKTKFNYALYLAK
ncbi:D-alanyl-D-alanine carboxypeptidase [Levilactobacillus namurensis DSM 19117]|uniref:D-alanyl-D-alanine carboxypeptidase n=1 Tax=Levilactobacillus namurensis DSM 19117 TaxID=1423773 RepID=A0A0R1JTS0_9LACO|nr:D-alanyl-D-alanine carboxypeptidase [Levilactobacillus namurensis]KRK74472.1 D-alanyl-D-alanine carboxypeptidase [Levilactobacillus namurensis DSM 19117]GEO74245.1 hypothetical protein LNA02_09430 [Levilactobacillus namurensis]